MTAGGKKNKKADAQREPAASVERVSWPSLDPLCPTEDLHLHHLVPSQIVTISRLWTAALCRKYVNFLGNLPLTTTPGTPKRGDAVRVNDRFQVDDAAFAETLWSSTGLKELIEQATESGDGGLSKEKLWGGQVVGLNPNIRVYRYRKGQFFDQHYDDSNTLTHPGPPETPVRTTWTLLLYLTSPTTGCVGGETVFYPEGAEAGATKSGAKKSGQVKKGGESPEPVVVGLETGMALLHRHGKDCMLHEGREVVEGEKWVIRSDLCVKR